VLDWYHAVEHLREVARAYFGEASDMVTPWPKVRFLRGSAWRAWVKARHG
jgi:hypothetical protein